MDIYQLHFSCAQYNCKIVFLMNDSEFFERISNENLELKRINGHLKTALRSIIESNDALVKSYNLQLTDYQQVLSQNSILQKRISKMQELYDNLRRKENTISKFSNSPNYRKVTQILRAYCHDLEFEIHKIEDELCSLKKSDSNNEIVQSLNELKKQYDYLSIQREDLEYEATKYLSEVIKSQKYQSINPLLIGLNNRFGQYKSQRTELNLLQSTVRNQEESQKQFGDQCDQLYDLFNLITEEDYQTSKGSISVNEIGSNSNLDEYSEDNEVHPMPIPVPENLNSCSPQKDDVMETNKGFLEIDEKNDWILEIDLILCYDTGVCNENDVIDNVLSIENTGFIVSIELINEEMNSKIIQTDISQSSQYIQQLAKIQMDYNEYERNMLEKIQSLEDKIWALDDQSHENVESSLPKYVFGFTVMSISIDRQQCLQTASINTDNTQEKLMSDDSLQLPDIETKIKAIKDDIETIKNDIEKKEKELSSIRSANFEMKKEYNSLKKQIENTTNNVETPEFRIDLEKIAQLQVDHQRIDIEIEQAKKEIFKKDIIYSDVLNVVQSLESSSEKTIQSPRPDITGMCHDLKNSRSQIDEIKKDISIRQIELDESKSLVEFYENVFSQSKIDNLTMSNEKLRKDVEILKNRFVNSRSLSQSSSTLLTSNEEMSSIQAKIYEINQYRDVQKMKFGSIISKIDKQIKQMKGYELKIPDPPDYLLKHLQDRFQLFMEKK